MRGFGVMVEVVEADGLMGEAVEGSAATAVAGGTAKVPVPAVWALSVRLNVERCTPSACEEALPDVTTLSEVGSVLV